MDPTERREKQMKLESLQSQVAELQRELAMEGSTDQTPHWEAEEFYTSYYLVVGFVIGMAAAAVSLLFNVVGSSIVGDHPLQLIQVYLTFPLGEPALELERGITLTIGCCLYIITGMILGGPFHVLMMKAGSRSSLAYRMWIATLLATPMWLVHFYMVLAWLQPALFGGNWIVETVPWWVAWATHLVFGWTMALLLPLGRYVPYYRQTDIQHRPSDAAN